MADNSRCTLCGAARIPLNREGTRFGVCTFIECPDPMHDLQATASPAPQPSPCPHCVDGKIFTDSTEPDCVTCDGTGVAPQPEPTPKLWSCVNCRIRVKSRYDLHINERLVCVQCNAEMEPWTPGMPVHDKSSVPAPPSREQRICGNCGLPLEEGETEEMCREIDAMSERLRKARESAQPKGEGKQ